MAKKERDKTPLPEGEIRARLRCADLELVDRLEKLTRLIQAEDSSCPSPAEFWLAHLLGGHGTGKSALMGEVGHRYGISTGDKYCMSKKDKGLLLLGPYKRSAVTGAWTGGMDALGSATNTGRRDMVKIAWASPYRVIGVEGHMTMYWPFFETYIKSMLRHKRKLSFVLLVVSLSELKHRLDTRYHVVPWAESRLQNIIGKQNNAVRLVEDVLLFRQQNPEFLNSIDLHVRFNSGEEDRESNVKFLMDHFGLSHVGR